MDYNDLTALSDEALQEVLTGYALGALEPDEMLAVEEYLQAHPEITPVVQRLEEAATAFAYAAPPVTPPVRVKDALMARVQADMATHAPQDAVRSRSSSSASTDLPAVSAPQPASRAFSSERRVGASRQPSARRPAVRPSLRWSFDGWLDFATGWKMATVASGAALLFFVIVTTQLAGRLADATAALAGTQAQLADVTAQLDVTEAERVADNEELAALEAQVASLRAEKADLQDVIELISTDRQLQQQQIASLLNVNQVVTLDSTQETEAGGALFVGEDSLVLVLRGLQPLPDEQTYELWLIPAEGNPVSAGLVQVSGDESPTITADIRLSTSSFAAVGLSIEQRGGSTDPAGPEGPVILLGTRDT